MDLEFNENNYDISKFDYIPGKEFDLSDDEAPKEERPKFEPQGFKSEERPKFEPKEEGMPDLEEELEGMPDLEEESADHQRDKVSAPVSQAEKDKIYIEHLTKVNKILNYFNQFPDIFSPISTEKELEQLSSEELSAMLRQMQIRLNCRSNYTMIEKSLSTTPLIVEGVTTRFGLKTRGLAQCCLKSKSFQDSLKTLALKYSTTVTMSPEMQLIASFTEQVYLLHTINTQREKIMNERDSKNKEEKKEEVE